MKKPTSRSGATAGLSNAYLAGCDERFATDRLRRQAEAIARRYNITLPTAFVVAELAFGSLDAGRR